MRPEDELLVELRGAAAQVAEDEVLVRLLEFGWRHDVAGEDPVTEAGRVRLDAVFHAATNASVSRSFHLPVMASGPASPRTS